MLNELDDAIQAFSENAVSRVVNSVRSILENSDIHVIFQYDLEYNDNNYYFRDPVSVGFVLDAEKAREFVDDRNLKFVTEILDRRWMHIEDDYNHPRRYDIAARIAPDREGMWDVTLQQVADACNKQGLDFIKDYAPKAFFSQSIRPL